MYSLTLLLLTPLLGALLIALLPGDNGVLLRRVAIMASGLALALAWALLWRFDSSLATMQFAVTVPWNPRLGTNFALGIDGISFPMVLLATLLSFIAVLASASITERSRGYYALLLLLEAAMLGVFMAQDWLLFYVFWELTLIPLFFLINGWGGKGGQGASLNFVLYTMGGSVFMLLALLLVFDVVGLHSFAAADLLRGGQALSAETQLLIFLGFLIGFGVKMPIFPLHGWLPLAHVEAPSPVSILLSGALLKMGAYGLIRVIAMLPQAAQMMQGVLLALALTAILYGGLLAWRQSDLKRMIAYSSVSHMGVVLLGIATLSTIGLTGAVLHMVAHGLVAAALFLLVGLLYERTHSRDINDYSSLVRITPRFALFTSLAFIAAVGMPGTAGFVAELHVLIGGFERWGWWVVVISLGVLISAAYAVRTVGHLFTGPVRPSMHGMVDLQRGELFAASVLTAGFLGIGFVPAPLLQLMGASVAQLGGIFIGVGE
jgi:NADH-quinone oxidoreductase subunit M